MTQSAFVKIRCTMKLVWGVVSVLALASGALASDGDGCKDICSSSFDGMWGEMSSTRTYMEVVLNSTFDYAIDSLEDLVASSETDLTTAATTRLEDLANQQSRIARLHEMLENAVAGKGKPKRRLSEDTVSELSALPSITKVYQGQSWVILGLQTVFALALGVGYEHYRVAAKTQAAPRNAPPKSYQSYTN